MFPRSTAWDRFARGLRSVAKTSLGSAPGAKDTYWNGIYPFIDYSTGGSTGGSIDGMIAASDANPAATTDRTIVIPGHGHPVSNRAELQAFRDMLVGIRGNVAPLDRQGRSMTEAAAAKPTAAFAAKWGNFVAYPG